MTLTHRVLVLLATSCTIVASARTATADEAPAAPAARSDASPSKNRTVSLTVDPLSWVLGVGSGRGEVRAGQASILPSTKSKQDISFGGSIGIGQIRSSDFDGPRPVWSSGCHEMFSCKHWTAVRVGGQALVYPLGTFDHGMQLGVEATVAAGWGKRRFNEAYKQFVRSSTPAGTPAPEVTDQNISEITFLPGIVIGYKLVTKSGFTFNPQAAANLEVSSEPATIVKRVDLAVGWSF